MGVSGTPCHVAQALASRQRQADPTDATARTCSPRSTEVCCPNSGRFHIASAQGLGIPRWPGKVPPCSAHLAQFPAAQPSSVFVVGHCGFHTQCVSSPTVLAITPSSSFDVRRIQAWMSSVIFSKCPDRVAERREKPLGSRRTWFSPRCCHCRLTGTRWPVPWEMMSPTHRCEQHRGADSHRSAFQALQPFSEKRLKKTSCCHLGLLNVSQKQEEGE